MSGLLFALGLTGVVLRRNALVTLMPEMTLMLPTWRRWPFHYRAASRTDPVFFTIVIAAAEVVVGLAIFVALFARSRLSA